VNEPADTEDALLRGLGRVVRAASQLDHSLRTLFSALVGSKYAAVVAAGQPMEWLCTSCIALLKAHREVAPEDKEKLAALLRDAKAAAKERNRLVHDLWAYGADGMFLMRSQRGTHELTAKPVTLEEVEAVERGLTRVSVALDHVVADALGDEALTLEAQLRWEDYLASLSPDERAAMAERYKRALLDKEREASGDQIKDVGDAG
jgi:hypothetical protein